MRPAPGFTLIELLVVLAVIGLLTAVALPLYSQAQAGGRQAACLSNMRQINLALIQYANDHEGEFPDISGHGGAQQEAWPFTLREYLANVAKVMVCPADPHQAKRVEQRWTSYVFNEYLALDEVDPFGTPIGTSYKNLRHLPAPTRTITFFIGPDALNYLDHTHSRSWAGNWNAVKADISPDRHRTGSPAPDRSRGAANYAFADGHIEKIDARAFKRRIDAGENPAEPPAR